MSDARTWSSSAGGGPPEFVPQPCDGPRTVEGAVAILRAGGTLSAEQSAEAFEAMMSGAVHHGEIGALLALLSMRVPTSEEIVGAARVMRRHVDAVTCAVPRDRIVDTAGTGGAPKTFNVSTAAAIVAAAVGALESFRPAHPTPSPLHGRTGEQPTAPHTIKSTDRALAVAKHGNRSRTGRGSAEVLAALGVNVDAGREVQARCLAQAGVCFCFAIHHHPATRYVMPVRKALGFPTIFNLLGPLTNPAGAKRQVMGVYGAQFVRPIAEALLTLGATRALVVHSDDGLDEVSISAATRIAEVRDGAIHEWVIEPEDAGLNRWPREQVTASDLDDAARMVREVLDPEGPGGGPLDMTLLNAAAALLAGDVVGSLREGVERAREVIQCGAAQRTLESLARLSNAS